MYLNQKCDIRKGVIETITKGKFLEQKISSTRHKILLIDEVDVFFSKDFYGN